MITHLALALLTAFPHHHKPTKPVDIPPMFWTQEEDSPAYIWAHADFRGAGFICGQVQPHQTFEGMDKWGTGPLTRQWDFYTMTSGGATKVVSGYNVTLPKAKEQVEKYCPGINVTQ